MHTTDALAAGETARRLSAVVAWRETPFFTERERAALAWTESITLIADTHAPDEDYQALHAQFTEQEAVNLTLLIRSEEHTSELQSLMRISYAVFCLKQKTLHDMNDADKH